jgi:hypothetical protein
MIWLPLCRRLAAAEAVHSWTMSTTPRASRAVTVFVPAYLLVVGLGLLLGAAWLYFNEPDDPFVAVLSLLGGVTMWVGAAAMLAVARRE